METMEQLFWVEEFKVRAYEVGPNGKASMQTIFNYLQEAASNHAAAFKADKQNLEHLNLTWVLSRVHVQMERFPFWHQIVRVETWPSKKELYYGLRDFLILDEKQRVLGRATTSWMMIDFSKRRPVKLPDFLDSIENKEKGRALDDPFDRLPVLKTVENERKFIVRYSDLDVNNHVNSGHYITWALEAIPMVIREKYQVKDIQINYRAEAVYGDRVLSQIEAFKKKDGFEVLHRVLREKDGKELCRAVSQWTAAQS